MWIKRRAAHARVAVNFPFRRHDFACGGVGGNHIALLSRHRKRRSFSRRLFPFPSPLWGGVGVGVARSAPAATSTSVASPRRDFCSHPSYEGSKAEKLRRNPDLRQINPAVAEPGSSRSGTAHERTNGKKEKEAERRQALSATACPRGKRAPCRARSPVRRSTAALSLGLTPILKVQPRTRLRGSQAPVCMAGGHPRRPVRPGSSEHLACRS